MGKEAAKKAATAGLIFSGLSALFLVAMIVAVQSQQPRSPGQKDWGLVLGIAFGVPCSFFLVAAVGSFLISAIRALRMRSWESRESSISDQTSSSGSQPRRVRHPAIITLAGLAILIASAQIRSGALFFVGIPALIVTCGIAGGARLPGKVPLSDTVLYVGISVAIVVGALVYALYHH